MLRKCRIKNKGTSLEVPLKVRGAPHELPPPSHRLITTLLFRGTILFNGAKNENITKKQLDKTGYSLQCNGYAVFRFRTAHLLPLHREADFTDLR